MAGTNYRMTISRLTVDMFCVKLSVSEAAMLQTFPRDYVCLSPSTQCVCNFIENAPSCDVA